MTYKKEGHRIIELSLKNLHKAVNLNASKPNALKLNVSKLNIQHKKTRKTKSKKK